MSDNKTCTKCGEEKPATLEYFHRKGEALHAVCKVCRTQSDKAYREANKEAIAERKKAYREANKEAIIEYKKAYYKANREAIAEKERAHYLANREAILETNKAYREANKEVIAERKKAYREANKKAIAARKKAYYEANKEASAERKKAHYRTPRGKFNKIKGSAKERDLNFSLPFELYETQLWGKPCHYCGCKLEVTGLDRKDSSKGYSRDNVVPCCWDCNRKKSSKTYDLFVLEQNLSEGHNK